MNPLVERLEEISKRYNGDPERAHLLADDALLSFIATIQSHEDYMATLNAWGKIERWYA